MNDPVFFFSSWESLLRLVVVGTLAYAALVVLLRVSGSRTLASMNAFDFIITVAIGAIFGRVLTAKGVSLAEALVAFLLIVLLQYLVTWLQIRSPTFSHYVTARPVLLYYRGALLRDLMKRERITEDELMGAVRKEGAGSLEEVEAVVLETDGSLSVVRAKLAGDRSALGDYVSGQQQASGRGKRE